MFGHAEYTPGFIVCTAVFKKTNETYRTLFVVEFLAFDFLIEND